MIGSILAVIDAHSIATCVFCMLLSSEITFRVSISLGYVIDSVFIPPLNTIVNKLKMRIENASHISEMGYHVNARVTKGSHIEQLLHKQTKPQYFFCTSSVPISLGYVIDSVFIPPLSTILNKLKR
ncbi:hypothetical protein AVEN_247915-1 [Araneus ventricosus]|uniref:Uncharacterized protein n=1 Tax=Araneus ventricosus TaxID=182803 RepID=A0A4Y2VDX6_ARAVE|nr:hypothetical protein AVEN_247915-1 [Araneus ventricosus]